MYKRTVLCGLLLSGLLVMGLAGCASKVTSENFEKVKTDMTLAEVEGILGKGELQVGAGGTLGGLAGSGEVYKWTDGEKVITITFVNGKVKTSLQTGL